MKKEKFVKPAIEIMTYFKTDIIKTSGDGEEKEKVSEEVIGGGDKETGKLW